MKLLGTLVLETERLILRPFKVSDAADLFHNWASDNNVTRYLTWPTHSSMDVTKMVIKSWIDQYEDLRFYQWCIEYKENHQAIGSISVVELNENIDGAEIGYCIGVNYWNQGITAEACKAVIEFLFEQVECNRISAKHDINNPNSGKVMKKCGMKYEGTLLQAGRNNLGICDLAVYGLIRKHYYEGREGSVTE